MKQVSQDWVSGNIKCHSKFQNVTLPGYCPAAWDNYICWPPNPASSVAKQLCPGSSGGEGSKFAYRTCRAEGVWEGNGMPTTSTIFNSSDDSGWTNFSHCTLNPQQEQLWLQMAERTRGFELVGLAISMISLVLAIFTFCHFRNLWNNRTRIHKNLFMALSIQVLLRLIVYMDQFVSSSPTSSTPKTKNNSGYVCESFYLLFEYAKTCMFLWLFVDGLYLHNVMTVAIVSERLSQTFYYCAGWGSPIFLTVFWALAASEEFQRVACSWGINSTPYFLILEVPRCTIIALSSLILLNIIRLLVSKTRESSSPEIIQVRKALRTSLLLLPLLGTTNYLRMIYSPVNKSEAHVVTWSYLNAFLTSFQGFFCALICCFLNGEVQLSIKLRLREWRRSEDSTNSDAAFTLATNFHQRLQQKQEGLNGNDHKSDETIGGDPFKENWSEVELSSHNNVDIEHIEIPTEYIIRQSRSSNTCNKLNHSSVSVATGSGANLTMTAKEECPIDPSVLNHVTIN